MCSAGTRAFHLGFGHARTGFGFQAGTDVNDVVFGLRLALRIGCRRILGAAARRDKGEQEQQGKNSRHGSRALSQFLLGCRWQRKCNCKNAARTMTTPDSLYMTIVVALTTLLLMNNREGRLFVTVAGLVSMPYPHANHGAHSGPGKAPMWSAQAAHTARSDPQTDLRQRLSISTLQPVCDLPWCGTSEGTISARQGRRARTTVRRCNFLRPQTERNQRWRKK